MQEAVILAAITESERRQIAAINASEARQHASMLELKADMATALVAVSDPCKTCTKTASIMTQTLGAMASSALMLGRLLLCGRQN